MECRTVYVSKQTLWTWFSMAAANLSMETALLYPMGPFCPIVCSLREREGLSKMKVPVTTGGLKMMWDIREQPCVPDDYVCRKCDRLQLLTGRIVGLERQLDTLRSIQGAESVMDTSYREVVSPEVQSGTWVSARRGRVKDISEQLYEILKGEGEQPEVMVRIGTNDI
eukprot:g44265.t1